MVSHGEPFLERLVRGPIICDGAMGTILFARSGSAHQHTTSVCLDDLNRSHPELVQSIHQEYCTAGAAIIETNTFSANSYKLGRYGLSDVTRTINKQGVRLAREAREVAGLPVFIAGSVGPSGLPVISITDPIQREQLHELFKEQIDALVEGGVDLIILETFSNLMELSEAVSIARSICDLPVIAQMTFAEDGHTLAGQTPSQVVKALVEKGAHVVGANCGMGPAGTLDVVTAMSATINNLDPSLPKPALSAQPNAGLPSRVDGRFLYVSTPDYFADYANRFKEVGVSIIGGCCGTVPQHINAMAKAIQSSTATTISIPGIIIENPRSQRNDEALLTLPGTPTRWQQKLMSGEFAVSIELDPPKGLNPTKVLAGAEILRQHGVEFVNIADSPTARVRMGCISLARLFQERLDIEPIIHFTTRDRNLMAIQSDLLGAHVLGLRNILALTGDPLRSGEYPNLTGVWDIDSIGLVNILGGMNQGNDSSGSPLGGQASFYIGAALDVNVGEAPIDLAIEQARNKLGNIFEPQDLTEQELEFKRYQSKIEAGAHFIMTQFIYDLEPLRQFYRRFGKPPVPIIHGIQPLYSYKQAEFLHNEVRGVSIPLEIRERMRAAGDRSREVGLEIAHELVKTARDEGLIQGCYIVPSFGRYDLVSDLAVSLM
jgi:methionine synthase I (cobalamin-dependent)/5,10-methylenetetrahydrofolate reductase